MNIWVVGRNYPSKENNQQGSFELEQAQMLEKRGNHVVYIACRLHAPWRREKNGFSAFRDGEVEVRKLTATASPHFSNPSIPFPYFPKSRNRKWNTLLQAVEKEFGLPDVIHIHYPTALLASDVFKAYHDRGVKIFVTEHWGKALNKNLDAYERKEQNNYLSFANGYMSVGYSLRNAIREMSQTKREIIIMPDVINDVFLRVGPHERSNRPFTFCMAGRLAKEKNMDLVIRAFSQAFQGKNGVQLVLIGGGKERGALIQLAQSLGVQNQVIMKGLLSREETARAINASDCLICFSDYETFGVPIIEAWATGIPVITTAASSIMEQWDERLGISLQPRDTEGLKKAMQNMADGARDYDSGFIARYAAERYSEDAICARLMDIYNN